MDILIRAAGITDPDSTYHQQKRDLLISDGRITEIARSIKPKGKVKEIVVPGLNVSPGWVDMQVRIPDPGHEFTETLDSGLRAAARGGFTHVVMMPDTSPLLETKAQADALLSRSKNHLTQLHLAPSATRTPSHTDLADLFELHQAGAVAFTQPEGVCWNNGLTQRIFLYLNAFHGLMLYHPEDSSLSRNGCMHEGRVSTRMGLPPIPACAEEIALQNALALLEETQSRLHIRNISLKTSAAILKGARKKLKNLSCGVAVWNLWQTDENLMTFNTQLKVNPPLRTESDRLALIKALAEGTIDTLTSGHTPRDEDEKKSEFDKAAFGMAGLETTFSVARTATRQHVPLDVLVQALSHNARRILQLPAGTIEKGAEADLTLFLPDAAVRYTAEQLCSKAYNHAYLQQDLNGKVVGCIRQQQYIFLS